MGVFFVTSRPYCISIEKFTSIKAKNETVVNIVMHIGECCKWQ